jgi:protein-tyrosine phosphatase
VRETRQARQTREKTVVPEEAEATRIPQARVLIVCTGNICRSPFIERLLQHELDQRRRTLDAADRAVLVSSAGTGALSGWPMDKQAAAQLVAYGGDPVGFVARDLTPALIAESDVVLTATRSHRGKVAAMYPRALRSVFTFRDFADLVARLDEHSAGGTGEDATSADPQAWVRRVTDRAAASRGLNPPLEAAEADVVDPFGRDDAVFATMARQVVGSMPAVVRALAG